MEDNISFGILSVGNNQGRIFVNGKLVEDKSLKKEDKNLTKNGKVEKRKSKQKIVINQTFGVNSIVEVPKGSTITFM